MDESTAFADLLTFAPVIPSSVLAARKAEVSLLSIIVYINAGTADHLYILSKWDIKFLKLAYNLNVSHSTIL